MVKAGWVLAAALLMPTLAFAQTLTNDQVVRLSQAGLGAEAIVAKVRASTTRFDVSTDAMVALRRAGVPDAVIAAMVVSAAGGGAPDRTLDQAAASDPAAPHAPGVYLLQPGPAPRMQRLDPRLADDVRTSSILGWMFSYGLAQLKLTTVLDGPTASVHAETSRPTFYFYFNQPGSGLVRNGMGTMRLGAPSPTEFTLLKLQVAGDVRQVITERIGGAGARPHGPADQSRVAFTAAQVGPGVFSVTPDADLRPGEYAFEVTPTDADNDAPPQFFDFSAAN